MSSILIVIVGLISSKVLAGPVFWSNSPAKNTCQDFSIPVAASAAAAIYNIPLINNSIDATAWAIESDTWSSPKGVLSVVQNTTIAGIYNIHAKLCIPSSSSKSDILQIATHGLSFDSRYWDVDDSIGPSYIDAVLGAGYSILTYDRLGTGQSDKPDGYSIVQAPVELEILHQITLLARNGSLAVFTPNSSNIPTFSKVIHIGHSFGSFLSSAYISVHGAFSDGAVLTGYIPNQYLGTIGATAFSLVDATDRPSGYLVSTVGGLQTIFFAGNNSFTPEAVHYADSLKQAIPVVEYESAYVLLLAPPDGLFKGPVQYFEAEFDYFICRGDCKGTYNETLLRQILPNSSELEVYIQPNTGHGFPLHKNASAGYQVMLDFLDRTVE